jgi:mannose-1-phosphate guanylyltransferase / mannose-6-phosphate isomerase
MATYSMTNSDLDHAALSMTKHSGLPAILPVILSGGAGSRLWPLSRERYPKQLLPLVTERTMIQDTVLRVSEPTRFLEPLIICNVEHRFIIAEQLRQIGVKPAAVMLEPTGRNTAPAAAVAALFAAGLAPDTLLLLLPADHMILDPAAFREAIDRAAPAAASGRLVTFGIRATAPETGYGYIERGTALAGHDGLFSVVRFTEKPPVDRAREYVAGGRHDWNSGMFLFRADSLTQELERHTPEVVTAARAAIAAGSRDLDFFRLDPAAFAASPNISIDYAVMEPTDRAVVVPCDIGWTDVGSWSALWDVGGKDENGNVVLGDVHLQDVGNSYVRSEDRLTAVIGLDDVIVVSTDDSILVAHRDRVQDVKLVVDGLKRAGRSEPLEHVQVHRPWGWYQSVHQGDGFQVKRITVLPGQKLSLQKHNHRAEHWVVVSGTALVTRGEDRLTLKAGESVYIPLQAVHRLENADDTPLHLIEVQTGDYLGEDDIIRLQDTYGRS